MCLPLGLWRGQGPLVTSWAKKELFCWPRWLDTCRLLTRMYYADVECLRPFVQVRPVGKSLMQQGTPKGPVTCVSLYEYIQYI